MQESISGPNSGYGLRRHDSCAATHDRPQLQPPAHRRWSAITASVIFMPIGLIFWQSFLNAPFFNPAHRFGFDAYAFIFEDSDFWTAFANSIVIAAGMVVIALPLGAALAFLLTRTDLPAQRAIEVLVLIPVFVSPMVLAFGYVVAMGPVGFYSLVGESARRRRAVERLFARRASR